MKNFNSNSELSFSDYLHGNSIDKPLQFEVNRQTRALVASLEELQRLYIRASEDVHGAVSSGFERLSLDLVAVREGLEDLTAAFHWGVSEILARLGRINDRLSQLVAIARTPSQTWAYEQFEHAREAFRRDLYDDALVYLNRAIHGYGSNPGYHTEYRFHFLLGTIRLGSFRNSSTEIVDLAAAEAAFVAAARYSRYDYPTEAAKSLLAAGNASYCRAHVADAERYTAEAVSLHPDLAEGHFQLAKLAMHRKQPEEGVRLLDRAISLDRGYALRALADDDFKSHESHVSKLIQQLRDAARTRAEIAMTTLRDQVSALDAIRAASSGDDTTAKMAVYGERRLGEAGAAAASSTYFGYLDARTTCEAATAEIGEVAPQALARIRARMSGVDAEITKRQLAPMSEGWKVFGFWGFVISCFIGIPQCRDDPDLGWAIVGGGTLGSIVLGFVGHSVATSVAVRPLERQLRAMKLVEKALMGFCETSNLPR